MAIQVVILAAGQGRRMYSNQPKVLHRLGGKALLEHVILTALKISPETPPIIVYGHQGERLQEALGHYSVRWAEQQDQLGTGHAVLQAMPFVADDDRVLILYGDVPLISEQTLTRLIQATPPDAIGMVTVHLKQPTGYGRILRDAMERVMGIVEEKDASEVERAITEINSGIYILPAVHLKNWLPNLNNQNAQLEYYLTDVISRGVKEKVAIYTVQPRQFEEILGVNDRVQLAHLERFYQHQYAEKLMRQGVTICDPHRLDIRGDVEIGRDVTLDVNVILEGRVVIGHGCVIGPNTFLRNTTLGVNVEIKANSIIDGAEIAAEAIIGPFARIRPGTVLASKVHIGNFVELKNSQIDEGSKVNHLSYVGDSEVGKRVNIGAGTITCNYDGVNKHKTVIGDDVQIGSDTQLIAPVTVGAGATIAAGSTIIKDAPPHQLTLTQHIDQRSMADWERPKKQG
ncbi:MAG: UDP-N-acetylglucosamine diphosphorylase/glucosamine-1-phosphate N-acetyltransferase [Gammaproteobacteria bacterium]|nr:MAG: UDP-N-acetylglucosamine diphosphorylase/glucosamine-1-phosphate N-acetyltransferase [Gammaproteobacteria bacterium]